MFWFGFGGLVFLGGWGCLFVGMGLVGWLLGFFNLNSWMYRPKFCRP